MNSAFPTIVLASASPRRLSLLQQLGLAVEVCPADIDESIVGHETGGEYVGRLSCEKASAVAADYKGRLVVGADTAIEINGRILGKPTDRSDCFRMLNMMQGKTHSVYTGVAITGQGRAESCVVETRVQLMPMTETEIDAYWTSGEPAGKAGSYAIQGIGAMLVKRIEGSYFNVVGLPLHETAHLLSRFGVSVSSILNGAGLLDSSHGDDT